MNLTIVLVSCVLYLEVIVVEDVSSVYAVLIKWTVQATRVHGWSFYLICPSVPPPDNWKKLWKRDEPQRPKTYLQIEYVRPAKIQISLRIRAYWSESSLGGFRIAKEAKSLRADNEDSDQTARMRMLIWAFVGRICLTVRFLTLMLKLLCTTYSRTSMARTSLGPWKFVRNMGSSSDWGLIMTPVQEANSDNLGKSFRFSTQWLYVECTH